MSKKNIRQDAVRAILTSRGGSTQEDIKSALDGQGIVASQATLSRDLREMGAVKVHVNGAGSVYRLAAKSAQGFMNGGITGAAAEFGIQCEAIANFLVVKTKPGNARDFCLVLDRQDWPEVVGTLAGDDTILIIARTPDEVESLMVKLKF